MARYGMNITEYINSTDAEERFDYESHVFENVWYKFVKHLPQEEDWATNSVDVWYYAAADEILCRTEELADMIADMLDDITGEHMAHSGYYDPVEDEKSNCVDGRTGWYYVDYD